MQRKYYLELSEAQAIHLRTAVRNELIDAKKEALELKKELEFMTTFRPNDWAHIALVRGDLNELQHMIKKLEQVKAQLYDIL